MRRLARTLAAVALLVLMCSDPVMAAVSQSVTVTAAPFVCGPPTSFTLWHNTDQDIGITWVKGASANNTMVRACVGRLPSSRTDGYEIYYGSGTSANDTGLDLDLTVAALFYRAFSQNAGGLWEPDGVSDSIGGVGMLLLTYFIVPLGLTITYAMRPDHKVFSYLAAGFWVIVGGYLMASVSESVWDIPYLLGFLSIMGAGVGMTLEATVWSTRRERRRAAAEDKSESDIDGNGRKNGHKAKSTKAVDQLSTDYPSTRRRRRRRQDGSSRFASTGRL